MCIYIYYIYYIYFAIYIDAQDKLFYFELQRTFVDMVYFGMFSLCPYILIFTLQNSQ